MYILITYYRLRMTNGGPDVFVREGAPQRQDSNFRTESNIWSQFPEWPRYLDILTD
jgi:hypothetical protein